MSHKLIVALRQNPDGFHGVGGLLLLSTLDDASRNAALCSSSGAAEIAKKLIDHISHAAADHIDTNAANQIMFVIQNCSDVSQHLYTVSESVHALMARELEAQADLNNQAMEMATKCTEAMKAQPKK
jgi:hypothetical protein